MVLIGGEAGVGKTTLVDEFSRRAAATATVFRTSCDALSTPGPLGAMRDLAPALGLQISKEILDGDVRERLFREVLAMFAARPGPTVIVGEDAHWSDGASLELLRFLGRRIGDLQVLFVVTYRDDEIGADHPLPPRPRRSGDGANRLSPQRLAVVGGGRPDAGGGKRSETPPASIV